MVIIHSLLRFWSSCVSFFSAEFLLKWNANSGSIVIARSFWSAFWFMVAAIIGNSFLDNGFSGSIDPVIVLAGFKAHPTWFALVFAAVYTALYTRFAAQWKYLADLYNAQKAVMINLSDAPGRETERAKALVEWKAGFVADAENLHLYSKDLFGTVVTTYLEDADVKNEYDEINGQGEADKLLRKIKGTSADEPAESASTKPDANASGAT